MIATQEGRWSIVLDPERCAWLQPGFVPYDKRPKRAVAKWRYPHWLFKGVQSKECAACGWRQPITAFHVDRAAPDGRVRCCKVCVRERTQRAYWANVESARVRARERYSANRELIADRRARQRDADRDGFNRKQREYARAHPEIVRASWRRWALKNAEHLRVRKRAWDAAHPMTRVLALARYRARLRASQLHPIRETDVMLRISVFGDACAYCGGPWRELDHVIPVARGGKHCIANLRPACTACNRRKSDTSHLDWLRRVARCEPLPLPGDD